MNIHTSESRLRFREHVSSEIERLIDLLDLLEDDPDLEESGDEQDFSAPGNTGQWVFVRPEHIHDDDEDGHDAEDDKSDAEPSLGWLANGSQASSHFAWGSSDGEEDAGDEPEDENEHGGDVQDEPHDDGACTGADYEYSLGWSNPRFPGEKGNPANPASYLPEGWSLDGDGHEGGGLDFTGEGGRAAHEELKRLNRAGRVPYSAVSATATWQHTLAPEPGSLFLRITRQ